MPKSSWDEVHREDSSKQTPRGQRSLNRLLGAEVIKQTPRGQGSLNRLLGVRDERLYKDHRDWSKIIRP